MPPDLTLSAEATGGPAVTQRPIEVDTRLIADIKQVVRCTFRIVRVRAVFVYRKTCRKSVSCFTKYTCATGYCITYGKDVEHVENL